MFSAKELAPTEDQGVIFNPIVDAPPNSTLDQTIKSSEEANRLMMQSPEAAYTFQITFPSGGFSGLVFKPWDDRKRTVFQILPEVQKKMSQLPGVTQFPVLPPALPGGGSFPVEFIISSTDEHVHILEFAKEIQKRALASKQFYMLSIDTQIDQPQSEIIIDRDKVAAMGLNLQQVGADLAAAVGGNYVNRFNIEGRSYKVIPQIKRIDRLNPSQLENIHVTGPNGQLIPLNTIAHIENKTVPRSLNRFQQMNAVSLSGVSGLPLDGALKYLESESAKLLPAGYKIDYSGESRQLRVEGDTFLATMGLALILIFLVLAAQFNSFRDPWVILLGSVPLAIFGSFVFIFLKMLNPNIPFFTDGWTTTFNIYAQVGLVTLVGLVSKNGILIVEFANKLQLQGLSKAAAVRESALTRLRPVLMTSFATIFGHFPLTLVTGAGAQARNSIGIVIVSGMAIGTFFTLVVLPSIYLLIAKEHNAQPSAAKPSAMPGIQPVPAK